MGVVAAVGERADVPVANAEAAEVAGIHTAAHASHLHRTVFDNLAERDVSGANLGRDLEEEGRNRGRDYGDQRLHASSDTLWTFRSCS